MQRGLNLAVVRRGRKKRVMVVVRRRDGGRWRWRRMVGGEGGGGSRFDGGLRAACKIKKPVLINSVLS